MGSFGDVPGGDDDARCDPVRGGPPERAVHAVAAPGDPVAAWLQFGFKRHGRVMVVGFRDASIPIELDRVFVPLYVYADRRRTGGGPGVRDDKDGLAHGGAEISFDDALELRQLFELVQGHDLPGVAERARSVLDTGDQALRTAARALVGMLDARTTAPREGQPFVEPLTGMAFVRIPGGRFVMGSSKQPGQPNYDPEAHDDELPAHPVQLTGFWMSVYPVTNDQYARFVRETGRAAPPAFADRRFNDPAQPVVTVSWDDARAFTAWLSRGSKASWRGCPPRPSGNAQPAAATGGATPGATSHPTLRARPSARNTIRDGRRWSATRPVARTRSASTTWPATSGSGAWTPG
jgi:hypothetical protein